MSGKEVRWLNRSRQFGKVKGTEDVMSDPQNNHATNSSQNGTENKRQVSSILDLLNPDDPLQKEMEKMLAKDPSFKKAVENVASETKEHRPKRAHVAQEPTPNDPYSDSHQLLSLQKENERLQERVEELEHIVEMTTNQSDEIWQEQQREYEAMLEEKSEIIRSLYQKIQKYKDKYAAAKSAMAEHEEISSQMPDISGDNPLAIRQELAAMRDQIERDRMQLREDEHALEEQMRQMEISMSKERVELARQKNEIQRMYQELQREIDQADRDGNLRERLAQIQQNSRPDSHPGGSGFQPRRAMPTQQSLPEQNQQANKPRPKSGFFGRMFGNDG